MSKQILIISTGQPSTNPRMLKEYEKLKQSGFRITVYYSYWSNWADETDRSVFEGRNIDRDDFKLIGGSPSKNRLNYLISKVVFKCCTQSSFLRSLLPSLSISRTSYWLKLAACGFKADLYIAHNLGALPAAVNAAKKFRTKAAFDAEDFHRGEVDKKLIKKYNHIKRIEDENIPTCFYLSAASPLIAERYGKLYNIKNVICLNNVFSRKYLQRRDIQIKDKEVLKLFWFSQTIGPDRGLETVIKAVNTLSSDFQIELGLLGNVTNTYKETLNQLATGKYIQFLEPVSPEEIFPLSTKYDIGLAVEVPENVNRDICLTNKIFTYLLSGNCLIFSNTSAQRRFLDTYPGIGLMYNIGDVRGLADLLMRLKNEVGLLESCQHNALKVAYDELNWETESHKLIELIEQL